MFSTAPTPFDVYFSVFGIPIRVHVSFWIVMALFGWHPDRPDLTFLWVLAAFISVLCHELGHAFMAEWFRWPSEILLYFTGGVCLSDRWQKNTPLRSIAVSLAGPGIGLCLAGVTYLILRGLVTYVPQAAEWDDRVWYFLSTMVVINVIWSLLNLMPVLPLDGGRVFESACDWFRLRSGQAITQGVSVVTAIAIAAYLGQSGVRFGAVMFAILALENGIGAYRRDRIG